MRTPAATAAVLGPGLGRAPGTHVFARAVVARAEVPMVLDADGLNAFAGRLGDLAGRPAETACATLTDRMLPDQEHEDDVCLLVLRLVPDEDRRL